MTTNTKTVIKFSPFTSALTRAFKSDKTRLHCHIDADGTAYVCNGYFLVKLTPAEYDVFVRPVSQRDAGDWVLDEKREPMDAQPLDMVKCLDDAAKTAAHPITAAPFLFTPPGNNKNKLQMVCYYSAETDFVTGFNANYDAILSPNLERRSGGSSSPMVAYSAGEPVAMVLPIRISDKPDIIRTVRAWFSDGGENPENKTAEKLQQQLDELKAAEEKAKEEKRQLQRDNEGIRQEYAKLHTDCVVLQDKINELTAALTTKNEQIEALTERLNAQPESQPAASEATPEPVPADKAAALVEKLAAFPGVTATVKGAQTAAPVVWLSGDTDAHKNEIEKMGGKWSVKRSAWYFKI